MRSRPVNFVYNASPDYKRVQDQIFGLIRDELRGVEVTDTVEERSPEAINFGLHIRLGRGERARPMPIDVLMSHGLADKSYMLAVEHGTRRRLVNAYEHVLVPGDFIRNRILRLPWYRSLRSPITLTADQVHNVGWPRLDKMVGEPRRREPGDRLRVLWAPSHDISNRKAPFSSYPAFQAYLPRLEERYDVRVSLHPSNRTDKSPTVGALDWADVVISDFGTMLYEAWALKKCVVMPSWLMPSDMTRSLDRRMSAEGRVYARRIGSHARSFDELVEMIDANQPPDAEVRRFMDGMLDPGYRGRSAARIAELLTTLPLKRHGGR